MCRKPSRMRNTGLPKSLPWPRPLLAPTCHKLVSNRPRDRRRRRRLSSCSTRTRLPTCFPSPHSLRPNPLPPGATSCLLRPNLIATQPAATALPQHTTNLPCDISACECSLSVRARALLMSASGRATAGHHRMAHSCKRTPLVHRISTGGQPLLGMEFIIGFQSWPILSYPVSPDEAPPSAPRPPANNPRHTLRATQMTTKGAGPKHDVLPLQLPSPAVEISPLDASPSASPPLGYVIAAKCRWRRVTCRQECTS